MIAKQDGNTTTIRWHPIKQTVNSLTCSDRDIQLRTVVQFNNKQLSFTGRLYTRKI
jgi:hypothetical protein